MEAMKEQLPEVVCTLDPTDAAVQLDAWPDLMQVATQVTSVDDGARIVLPGTYLAQIEALAEQESGCCKFLDIDIKSQPDTSLIVRITSINPDAKPIIDLMAGLTTP